MKKRSKRRPMRFRDVMEITSGFAEENAKIKNRTDPKTGAPIPDGMPLWRWRRDRRRNSPCKCGSGKKHKDCCEYKEARKFKSNTSSYAMQPTKLDEEIIR